MRLSIKKIFLEIRNVNLWNNHKEDVRASWLGILTPT